MPPETRWTVSVEPAPTEDPTSFLESLSPSESAFFIKCPDGRFVAAGGVAARGGRELLSRIERREGAKVLFVGGLPFDEARYDAAWAPWKGLRFHLPRWTLARTETEGPILYQSVFDASVPGAAVSSNHRREPEGLETVLVARDVTDDGSRFSDEVRCALDDIRTGLYEKVVLARREPFRLSRQLGLGEIVDLLSQGAEASVPFAWREGGVVFCGRTPERLLRQEGSEVHTEALAGTARGVEAAESESLLSSAKDRREHDAVVRSILTTLRELGAKVDLPETPVVRRLQTLTHLCTPIRASLPEPKHVLDLGAALHPTPAVCGLPREVARAAIARLEPEPRGFFSGAVGFFDECGNGELFVALRSGIIDGDRGLAFAGAGLVEGSVPEQEFLETRAKMSAFLGRLGKLS